MKIRHCQPISNRKRFAVEEIVKAFPRDDVEVNERNAKWREFLTKAKEARKRLAESKGSSISPPS